MRSEPGGHADWLTPEGLPPEVGAVMATRLGGVSLGLFAGLNLRPAGLPPSGPGDDPEAIAENQRRFGLALEGAQPVWLNQVHGVRVQRLSGADLATAGAVFPEADACLSTERGVACTVMVADCLPVLFAAPAGRGVAASHAGWRGLAGGVLENTVVALCEAAACEPGELRAWMGACIGPERFEVGDEVRTAFGPAAAGRFRPGEAPGKWWADLPGLALDRLQAVGLRQVSGGSWCTHSLPSRFFSFRRDRVTGRHAAAIWIR